MNEEIEQADDGGQNDGTGGAADTGTRCAERTIISETGDVR